MKEANLNFLVFYKVLMIDFVLFFVDILQHSLNQLTNFSDKKCNTELCNNSSANNTTDQKECIQTVHWVPSRDFGYEAFSSVWSVAIKWSKVQYPCLLGVIRLLRIDRQLTTLYKNGYSILLINSLTSYLIKWSHLF